MKPINPLRLWPVAALVAALAPPAHAFTVGGKMDMAVVAEQEDPATAPAPPTAGKPAYYAAYDGGYIEAGDPIAGEVPPTAAAVAQALRMALAQAHYQPATGQAPPSLLLVYHWGLLNRDSFQVRSELHLQPNLLARIALVAPQAYARRIEEDLLDRRQPVALHIPIIDPTERDLLQLVRDNRYFVIVSAYDYAAVAHHAARLVWRVKLSTRSSGIAMVDALPALLRGGAPYFGGNWSEMQAVREAVVPPGRVEVGTPKLEEFLPPPEVQRALDPQYLDGLIRRENDQFKGERPPPPESPPDEASTASAPSAGPAYLPADLAARIRAYEQDKSALQASLAALVKTHSPGADTRQAIDGFDRDNARRITALTAEREAIRDQLARLAAAATDAAAGKSLETLQREFAADVKQLAANPAGGAD